MSSLAHLTVCAFAAGACFAALILTPELQLADLLAGMVATLTGSWHYRAARNQNGDRA
jgi:hypothetical protein